MPRRIELELTSERPDGTWTWRAAGAREPKGELGGTLLPGGCKVGDVLRAEADFDVDGITVLSVLPPKGARTEPERLEVIGPQREFTPVTSTLVGKGDRGPRQDRGDRPDRGDRGPRPRRDDRPGGAGGPGGPRGPRTEGARGDRPQGAHTDRPRAEGPRPERPRRERPAPPPPKPKPKKLRAGRQHRDALIAGLSPEQQPIAEQLFRGGMPSVRTALQEQNERSKAEGLPEMPADTVLAIAEDLVGRVRVADWLDRAEAAVADVEEIALRDLRAVVASADDVARDESTRELATRLREVLDRRTSSEQSEWLRDLKSSLDGGRVVRALRLSSRPPQPGETLPEELTTKLAEAASGAMAADIAPDRWATLLDAVAYSPVRRDVEPAGAPAEPGDELLAMARKHAGRVPAVAKLFGIEPPAAPASKRAPRAARPKPTPQKVSRPPLPPLPGGARRIPPPPRSTAPTAPAGQVPAAASADSPEPHGDVLRADIPSIAEPTPPTEPQGHAPSGDSPEPHGDVLAADIPGADATVQQAPEAAAPATSAPGEQATVAPAAEPTAAPARATADQSAPAEAQPAEPAAAERPAESAPAAAETSDHPAAAAGAPAPAAGHSPESVAEGSPAEPTPQAATADRAPAVTSAPTNHTAAPSPAELPAQQAPAVSESPSQPTPAPTTADAPVEATVDPATADAPAPVAAPTDAPPATEAPVQQAPEAPPASVGAAATSAPSADPHTPSMPPEMFLAAPASDAPAGHASAHEPSTDDDDASGPAPHEPDQP